MAPQHKLMVSIQKKEGGTWRREHCRSPKAFPFKQYYGNLSSFPHHHDSQLVTATLHTGCRLRATTLPGVIAYNTLILFRVYSPLHTDLLLGTDLFLGKFDSTTRVFSVQYSVHKRTSVPQQSADGKWDCSVPLWPSFSHHFPCDRQPQCRNGEE